MQRRICLLYLLWLLGTYYGTIGLGQCGQACFQRHNMLAICLPTSLLFGRSVTNQSHCLTHTACILCNLGSGAGTVLDNLIIKLGFKKFMLHLAVSRTWWRHQMETFSALLAICAGNSPVPGEFPTQRPVTRGFDVYFDLRPNKRLSK